MYVYVPHTPLGGLHIILNNNNDAIPVVHNLILMQGGII